MHRWDRRPPENIMFSRMLFTPGRGGGPIREKRDVF